MEEIVDIVDENDKVFGKATRKEAHVKGLLHRVVHIVIENSEGKILCLKRGPNVDTRPGYTSNCAGHVISGSGYEETAKRELEEELGIKAPVEFEGKIMFNDKGHNTIIGCFKAKHDGPFRIDKSELEGADFRDLKQIKKGIKMGEKYAPNFIKVIEKLYS